MLTRKEIKKQKSELTILSDVIESYEEMSALMTRKTKRNVLGLRKFLSGLHEAYGYAYYAYNSLLEVKTFVKYRKSLKAPALPHKRLMVLLSSNTGLYGDIISEVFKTFSAAYEASPVDVVVVGKQGRKMFTTAFPDVAFTYFEISDYSYRFYEVQQLYTFISQYTDVQVFHGYFENVLNQHPFRTFVLGEISNIEESIAKDTVTAVANFIFEPSVKDVYEYFKNQVSMLLIEQTVYESNLSKYASRMIHLDYATERIKNSLSTLGRNDLKLKHKKINEKLVANLHSFGLWN